MSTEISPTKDNKSVSFPLLKSYERKNKMNNANLYDMKADALLLISEGKITIVEERLALLTAEEIELLMSYAYAFIQACRSAQRKLQYKKRRK